MDTVSAIKIQKAWKAYYDKMHTKSIIDEYYNYNATKIQSVCRMYLVRCKYGEIIDEIRCLIDNTYDNAAESYYYYYWS